MDLRWCRVCGRFISRWLDHQTERRFLAFHAGPDTWPTIEDQQSGFLIVDDGAAA